MPKVRVLSGSQGGSIVEMDLPAAESAIASGYAQVVVEEAPPPAKASAKPKSEAKPKAEDKGGEGA